MGQKQNIYANGFIWLLILEKKSKGSIVFDEVAEKEFPKFDLSGGYSVNFH